MHPQEANELFAPVVEKFAKRRIITRGIDELWASDVLHMQKYAKENIVFIRQGKKKIRREFKYIFVVIDTCSKMFFLEKLENKTGPEATKAFEKIIKTSKRIPRLLHTDRGGEYLNTGFKEMLSKYDIRLSHTFTKEKSSIAERVIRTIHQKLAKYFAVTGKYRWINFLPKLAKTYNTIDVHRSLGIQPILVNKKNESEILKKLLPAQKVNPFLK